MATGNITRLEGVWPETHERAVRDSAGVNLGTKLGNINSDISQLGQEVNGHVASLHFEHIFPADGAIGVGTKYDFAIPAGVYNLANSKSQEINLNMYFYDAEGNGIKPVTNRGTELSSISIPTYASLNPYTFPADVAKVAFYSNARPSADMVVVFDAVDTVEIVGLKQRVATLENETTALEERVDALEAEGGRIVSVTRTEWSDVAHIAGYYYNGHHDSSQYVYIVVENLKEGDIVILASHTSQSAIMRFVDTYNGDTRVATFADNSARRRMFRCPPGVNKVYITFYASVMDDMFLVKGTFVEGERHDDGNAWSEKKESLAANTKMSLPLGAYQLKKNVILSARASFSSFSSVIFGQDLYSSKGARVEVDSENVKVYIRNEAEPIYNAPHGLTISSFVNIAIMVGVNSRATLVLVSDSGTFTAENKAWGAACGDVTFLPTMACTDVVMSYSAKDLLADAWVFGDSYISYSTDREVYYLNTIYDVYDGNLFSGFSGAGCADCIAAILTYLEVAAPKCIVWLAGMNDGDTENAANPTWVDSVSVLRDICTAYGAKLILATIPNVPSISHIFKNAIVENGEQYIDLAGAVGAKEAASTWTPSGALSSDNVHPTELGAQILAAQIITDFPQANRSN